MGCTGINLIAHLILNWKRQAVKALDADFPNLRNFLYF